ncbi:hypothetical protein [Pelagovum pacificum]|uniref:Pentapeptide repeat-containing protein n=1 Tax=Pelagovum pacificum TaxID=2588711 RepID=A0A5C5GII4_9RHOB|nr:hypothetical protein [Pelagovum pacificum]TNY33719.1 hypothetical protein FHY64_10765 [Pelagovum pacificum]
MSDPLDHFEKGADCMRCAALCCVALHFEKSAAFAIDKPAGVPCPNLADNNLCSIHDKLIPSGFRGCVRYDCGGAGQYVVEKMFDGRSWQDDPSLLMPMMEAFADIVRIHELAGMLREAEKLPLPPRVEAERQRHAKALLPEGEVWEKEAAWEFLWSPEHGEIREFLRSLAPYAGSLRQ